jgi:hypothetical protein
MIYVNPGAGPCESGTWDNAYTNIQQFIKDSEIPLHIVGSTFAAGEDGRYKFVLQPDDFKEFHYEIEMPGLPLKKVRYTGEKGQNIWNYPRLYVDGGSWVWSFATIKKDELKEQVKSKIQELEDMAEVYRQELAEFLEKESIKKENTDEEVPFS